MTLPASMPLLRYNSLLDCDSYKIPQWMFYRPGIKRIYSFHESRGGEHPELMLAGMQPLLYKLGQRLQQWEIDEFYAFSKAHFGFDDYANKAMVERLMNEHDGLLPLEIRAVPEGLMLPKRTPLFTSTNTADGFGPLVGWKETMMMRDTWGPSSIASRVFRMKKAIKPFFDETSDNGISPFAILDFCSRGVFGYDHSCLAGAAFNFMFQGSDNVPGIRFTNYYYDCEMAAYSVAATEHSIASGWLYNDDGYIDHALEVAKPGSILSLVGDTWNIYEFAKKLTREDRRNIVANKKLTLVDRPDSGERKAVLPEILRTHCDAFGTTLNSKGFEVVNLGLKALWADGMNENTVTEPFQIAKGMGISVDSVMTGSGGGISNAEMDRDTDKHAFKASLYEFEDGTRQGVFKDPITDSGKKSKQGEFAVIDDGTGKYITLPRPNGWEVEGDILRPVFRNGKVLAPETLAIIRARVDAQL